MSKMPIELLVAMVDRSGGAIAPPDVLALCESLRKYLSIVADMAEFVGNLAKVIRERGQPLNRDFVDFVFHITNRMEDARTVSVPSEK